MVGFLVPTVTDDIRGLRQPEIVSVSQFKTFRVPGQSDSLAATGVLRVPADKPPLVLASLVPDKHRQFILYGRISLLKSEYVEIIIHD